MKNKILVIGIFLMVMMSFWGCKSENLKDKQENNEGVPYPNKCNSDERIIYDICNMRLTTYNMKTMMANMLDTPEELKIDIMWSQYAFRNMNNLFTSGNQETNQFEIIELKNGCEVKSLAKTGKYDAIFPLASNGRDNFFVHYYYNKDMTEIENKRCICVYKNGKIIDYSNRNLKGIIIDAVIYKDEMIYTCADNLASETNNVYSLKINDIEGQAKLLKKNINDSMLICTKKGVLYASDKKFYFLGDNSESGLDYSTDIYSLNNSNYVFYIKNSSNAGLEFIVYDVEKKQKVWTVSNAIGYSIDNNQLVVYGDGFIKNKELE